MIPQVWQNIGKARRDDTREIERLLEQTEGAKAAISKEFMAAIKALAGKIDVRAIADLLRAGDIDGAIRSVTAAQIAAGMAPIAETLTRQAIAAAQGAAATIPALERAEFVFSSTNPQANRFLHAYAMDKIRELTTETRAAVRQIVTQGVAAGQNPMTTAIDVRERIGLTQRQAQAVANYRRLLVDDPREALQRVLRNRRYDDKVLAAIANAKPMPAALIDKMVKEYGMRMLRYRSEVIARTESLRAVNAGNQLAWQQAVDEGKVPASAVRRKWVFTHDKRTRHAHRLIPGMNKDGRGLNEPFATIDGPLMFPGDPNGPPQATINCRCTLVYRASGLASPAAAPAPRPAPAPSPPAPPPGPPPPAPLPRAGALPSDGPGFRLPTFTAEPDYDPPADMPDLSGLSDIVLDPSQIAGELAAPRRRPRSPYKPRPRKPRAGIYVPSQADRDLAVRVLNARFTDAAVRASRLESARKEIEGDAAFKQATPEQAMLVRWYTGGGYRELNPPIYNKTATATDLERVEAVNGALRAALQRYVGTVYRGSGPIDLEPFRKALREGSTATIHTLTSTSKDSSRQFGGALKFVIQSRTGIPVNTISLAKAEQEVLFPAGSVFRVLAIDERYDGTTIRLEDVSPELTYQKPVGPAAPKASDAKKAYDPADPWADKFTQPMGITFD